MTRENLRTQAWAAAIALGIRDGILNSKIEPAEMLGFVADRGRQALYYFDQIPDSSLPITQESKESSDV